MFDAAAIATRKRKYVRPSWPIAQFGASDILFSGTASTAVSKNLASPSFSARVPHLKSLLAIFSFQYILHQIEGNATETVAVGKWATEMP